MVEIVAIIRRKKASATKEELGRIGCLGYSVFPVLGRGRQRGLRGAQGTEGLVPPPAASPMATHRLQADGAALRQAAGGGMAFLPKVLFDLIVGESQAQETIEAIIRANQTGEFGDGRVFVIEVAEAYRISTGEREPTAEATEVASG